MNFAMYRDESHGCPKCTNNLWRTCTQVYDWVYVLDMFRDRVRKGMPPEDPWVQRINEKSAGSEVMEEVDSVAASAYTSF